VSELPSFLAAQVDERLEQLAIALLKATPHGSAVDPQVRLRVTAALDETDDPGSALRAAVSEALNKALGSA
jgi:hypothetical protein